MLDALAEAGAYATFFVVAPLASRYPWLIDRIRDSGHGVAFHCTQHVRHDALTPAEIRADTRAGLLTLEQLGHRVSDWRTPWGFVVPETQAIASEHGLRLVGWTANTDDWRGDAPEEMLARIEADLVPGAIVLMHDRVGVGATREGCAATVALVHPLVSLARSRGLEPAPLHVCQDPLPDRNPDFRAR